MIVSLSKRTCSRLKLRNQAIVRSTTQQVLPRPLPRGWPQRSISVVMPTTCKGLQYLS